MPIQWAHSTQSILRWITSKRRDGTGSTDTSSMRSRTRSHSGETHGNEQSCQKNSYKQQFISSRWRCAWFKCTDFICEELWISGHSNVQINHFILFPANLQERRDQRRGEHNDFCDQMPVWRVCSSDRLRWNKADLHHWPGQQQSQTWHLLPQVRQTQRRPEVHCKWRVNHDILYT